MHKIYKNTAQHPYRTTFGVSAIYFAFKISWMFGLRTSDIAGSQVAVRATYISAAIIMVSSFAVCNLLFIFLYKKLKLNFNSQRVLYIIPAIWILTEYIRAWLFSLITLGPSAAVGPFWIFGNTGLWLVNTPLIYSSRLGGLYVLTGLSALFVVATIVSFKKLSILPLVGSIVIACCLSLIGWVIYRTSTGQKINIAALQLSNFKRDKPENVAEYELVRQIPERSVDAIVLPEYSNYWQASDSQPKDSAFHSLKSDDGLLIDSLLTKSPAGQENKITHYAAGGKILMSQTKSFTIPGGEYIPYMYQVLLAYSGHPELLKNFRNQKSIVRGSKSEVPFEFNNISYGSLACSGAISPDLYRNITNKGAGVLTNSASLITLGLRPAYHQQALGIAKLHAVSNARPFVQSARDGYAFVLDKDGNVKDISREQNDALVKSLVASNKRKTLYTKFGDWIVLLSFNVIIFRFLLIFKSNKN